MLEKIKTTGCFLIILICLPYLVTFLLQGDFTEKKNDNLTTEKDVERLIQLVAAQMPVKYEKEALKAQTVIARTNLYYAREHEEVEPEGMSQEDMIAAYGEAYQDCYETLKQCVEDTANQVVTYEAALVQLPYHAVSAGRTRDASELGDKDQMQFLKGVESTSDYKSDRFLKIMWLEKKQYLNKLQAAYPKLKFPEDISNAVVVEQRDSAGYALIVALPDKKVNGEQFAQMLSLPSACFTIKEIDGKIRIVTKGYGHGMGLSQFGANELALQGKTYKEILNYYFNGITIETSSNPVIIEKN